MFVNFRTASLVLATGLAMATPAVSSAAEADQQSTSVSYRDLDLKSEQGVARLNQRVRTALNAVCGRADTRDLNARAQINRCRALAMTKAQDNVLLAVAAARSDTMLAQNTAAPSIVVGTR